MAETNTTDKMNQPTTQRTYKDRLFKFIFGNEEYKEYALDLYNAVNGSSYEDVNELTFTTIDDILFMGMRNDVSFLVEANMTLYEQQSSACPNMPLRGLIYFGRVYDSYLKTHALNPHSRSLLPLPTPRFVVFYNGSKEIPDRSVCRLSDLYEVRLDDPALELKVIVLNINPGHNEALLETCKTLGDYSIYTQRMRLALAGCETAEEKITAANRVIDECIRDGILADFLSKHREEAIGMSLFEYDEEQHLKTVHDEAWEDGYAAGEEGGIKKGEASGIRKGKLDVLHALVAQGKLSVEEATQMAGATVEEFEKLKTK